MHEQIRAVLEAEPRVAYALVFGSSARGTTHAHSDLDVAIGTTAHLGHREIGTLLGALEARAGRPVDLVLLDEAGPALAYRVFRDGIVVFERDHAALVARKAKAILDYLDFKPLEDVLVRGALEAARRGR